jgi:hypothetical protein
MVTAISGRGHEGLQRVESLRSELGPRMTTFSTKTTCSGQLVLSRLGPILALKYSLIEHHHGSQNSTAARQAHLSKCSLQEAAVGALRKSAQGRGHGRHLSGPVGTRLGMVPACP